MSETNGTADATVDGRIARRERNQQVVLDVVLEMFAEDMMFPSIEQASKRSGLSLRSLYRYFADPGDLVEAAIRRSRDRAVAIAHLHHIGQGEFDGRVADFVSMRVRLYESIAPVYRATLHNAFTIPRLGEELLANRHQLREQYELQFAPEFDGMDSRRRSSASVAGDLLTQLDSIEMLRRYRKFTVAEATTVLTDGLTTLLGS